MNYKIIIKFISIILGIEVLFMSQSIIVALIYHEMNALCALINSILIISLIASALFLYTHKQKGGFYAKEGFILTGLSWIVMSLAGALPFYISGEIPSFIDALFETVSGFTTTGSSVLENVEIMSNSLLYWRSFTHWIGGMGVLVFLLAIVPLSEKNQGYTLHILKAESPGPSVGKLVPRIRKTASILYILYIVLTILDLCFLLIGGMPLFDAICTAFGTAGTGGFGIKIDSLASYSPYIQNVTTIFMLLFGINFSCYYLLLLKRFKDVFFDEEVRFYFLFIFGSITLITINLLLSNVYPNIISALESVSFSVASIITTTGFATADFNLWPTFSKAILLFLMISGACAGSTGGGIKVSRLILLYKSAKRNVRQALHPHEIKRIRVNKSPIDDKIIHNVDAYLILYLGIIIISFLIISLDGFSIETNISAVIATINNIGPGFDIVGPFGSFSAFSPLSKLVLIFNMLAGRLEIMPILVLLSINTWRKCS